MNVLSYAFNKSATTNSLSIRLNQSWQQLKIPRASTLYVNKDTGYSHTIPKEWLRKDKKHTKDGSILKR